MSFFDALRHRARVLLRPRRYQSELDEEVGTHLSLEAMQQEHLGRGAVSAEDARFAARRRFGNVTRLNEETRRVSGLGFFDVLGQDARFAWRSFRRTPGFTAVAVLTLAIGIGANTALFSAVYALLLKPLPFAGPDRLMKVSLISPATEQEPSNYDQDWSYPKFALFRDAQTVFQDLALWDRQDATVTIGGEAERSAIEYVGGRYLPVLGLSPARGRNFLPEEDRQADGPRVAILSDRYWKRRFNADPTVLGKVIAVGRAPFTIVGVLPEGFAGLSGRADLLLPILSQSADVIGQAWLHNYAAVGRLKPGVSPAHATEVARAVGLLVSAAYPRPRSQEAAWGATARPLDGTRVDPAVRRSLLVLLGSVGLLLIIACANVANLFLVRAAGRRREIAVRLAVGAPRRRLVRQLLTESVLLSLAAGVASLALAWWGVELLSKVNPAGALQAQGLKGIGAVSFASIRLDLMAFLFAAAVALLTGILFGLIPALQATRPSLTSELKEGLPSSAPPRGRGTLSSRSVLATAEIGLALMLLAGSGLMLRSLARLLAVDTGFRPEQVLTLGLNIPPGYGRDSAPGFYDLILERLAAIPGVTAAALGNCPPLADDCSSTGIAFRDRPPAAPGSQPRVGIHWITPAWTEALGVPLLRGRLLNAADRLETRKVVLINQTAAAKFWPGQDALGRPVSLGCCGLSGGTAYVVGIIGNVRHSTLKEPPEPDAYVSFFQVPQGRMIVFLRVSGDPLMVAGPARQALREVAPGAPVYDVRTLEARASDALSQARFSAILMALFSGMALALATLGIYGVISFGVAQRTRELGIRLALGAVRRDVVRLVVRQGMLLAAAGVLLGTAGAMMTTGLLRSQLHEVEPTDPATFIATTLLIVGAALLATWLPARRAARVDPVVALKAE
jgi:putative ABC transport system permease protein